MANFNYELHFDWNATPRANGDGFPLAFGLVSFPGGNPMAIPSSHRFMAVDDAVGFNAINLTSGAGRSGYSIIGGSITFESDIATSPFNLSTMEISSIGEANGEGPSVTLPNQGSHPFWVPVVPHLQLTTPGTFQFTVTLIVLGPDNLQKTFVADPEMIVEGPAGG